MRCPLGQQRPPQPRLRAPPPHLQRRCSFWFPRKQTEWVLTMAPGPAAVAPTAAPPTRRCAYITRVPRPHIQWHHLPPRHPCCRALPPRLRANVTLEHMLIFGGGHAELRYACMHPRPYSSPHPKGVGVMRVACVETCVPFGMPPSRTISHRKVYCMMLRQPTDCFASVKPPGYVHLASFSQARVRSVASADQMPRVRCVLE